MKSPIDALLIRLDAIDERLDARRKPRSAPGQLGLFEGQSSGKGVKCGDGWINSNFNCHKGEGAGAARAGSSDELDTDNTETRMAFVKAMRERSVARPGASYTGNSLASALLVLCDKPGLVGSNARRMAKFLMDSNVVTVIDGISPVHQQSSRPGGKTIIKESQVKHLLTEETVAKLEGKEPMVRRIAENVRILKNEINTHEQGIELRREEAKMLGWDTRSQIEEHRTAIKSAKEALQANLSMVGSFFMGRPDAAGLANRNGLLRMRDEPMLDPRWEARSFDDADLTFRIERQVENYGQLGKTDSYTLAGRPPGRNERVFGAFVHEVGHMVHFASGDARGSRPRLPENLQKQIKEVNPDAPLGSNLFAMDSKYFVSDYSATNHLELFAESFTAFVAAPYELRRRSPEIYDWVDETLKKAIASPRVGTAA